jgi:Ser/Thr protein kinase RdoA (MazF antagonist)
MFTDFGRQLATLHNDLARITPPIGWIDGYGTTINHKTWSDYFFSEFYRIKATLIEYLQKDILARVESKFWERTAGVEHEKFPITLVWYDLNPTNFILDVDNAKIKTWLDPGAARFGPRLWDLAHAKLYLCRCAQEFEGLLNGYKSLDFQLTSDLRFLSSFEALIRLDDLALGLDTNWQSLVEECLDYWGH